MWDRTILKSNARVALTGRYWTAYAACVIVSLITGIFEIIKRPFTVQYNWSAGGSIPVYEGTGWAVYDTIGLLFLIFVGTPLIVGVSRFFVQNHFGVTDIRTVFGCFKRSYGNSLGAMFVTGLFIGLWCLLLIVPGIVEALKYSMVPFILSDNPSMPGSRARQISNMMTDGEKGSVFVLWLSFIGWYILAWIPCAFINHFLWPISAVMSVVIYAFVTPYVTATFAELYIFLRDRAIRSGIARPEEFGLVPPAPAGPQVPPVM